MFIDAVGKACPMPVILAKREIDKGESNLTVVVDNGMAVENLKRLAAENKYAVCVNELDGNYHVSMVLDSAVALSRKQEVASPTPSAQQCCTGTVGYAVFIGKDYVGAGDEVLGKNLMKMALYTLSQSEDVPETLIFMNSGVNLPTSEETQIIENIKALTAKGCQVLVCGTCLDFYGLKDNLKVGKISNMYEIMSKMQIAYKVITL